MGRIRRTFGKVDLPRPTSRCRWFERFYFRDETCQGSFWPTKDTREWWRAPTRMSQGEVTRRSLGGDKARHLISDSDLYSVHPYSSQAQTMIKINEIKQVVGSKVLSFEKDKKSWGVSETKIPWRANFEAQYPVRFGVPVRPLKE